MKTSPIDSARGLSCSRAVWQVSFVLGLAAGWLLGACGADDETSTGAGGTTTTTTGGAAGEGAVGGAAGAGAVGGGGAGGAGGGIEAPCPWVGLTVSVVDYWQEGDSSWSAAIGRADGYLVEQGGGTILFPAGDYEVVPTIDMSSDIKWSGADGARLYTQQSALYNMVVRTAIGGSHNCIENLVFDQWEDVAQVPQTQPNANLCLWFHVTGDDVVFWNCTFYTYGVCAVLSQSSYQSPTNTIQVLDSTAHFRRAVDDFYDVSVFNIDGRTVRLVGNAVEATPVEGFAHWKPRTAYEVHMPNGEVRGNRSVDTEIGILHLGWPSLWDTYEPDYVGSIDVADNELAGTLIGIDVWGASTIGGTVTRNLTIRGNEINGHLDANYVPVKGITLTDGDDADGRFENILIEDNLIQLTWDETLYPTWASRVSRYYWLVPGQDTGALFMNVQDTADGIVIRNNTVTDFPFSFLNIYRRGEGIHQNIEATGNVAHDCGWATPYQDVDMSLVNVGRANLVHIHDNLFENPSTTRLGGLNVKDAVTDLTFVDNPDLEDFSN